MDDAKLGRAAGEAGQVREHDCPVFTEQIPDALVDGAHIGSLPAALFDKLPQSGLACFQSLTVTAHDPGRITQNPGASQLHRAVPVRRWSCEYEAYLASFSFSALSASLAARSSARSAASLAFSAALSSGLLAGSLLPPQALSAKQAMAVDVR